MNRENVWTIASAMVTRYRESSFGGRASSSSDLHNIGWDHAKSAFVQGDLYGFGTGERMGYDEFPCDWELAEGILTLCQTDEVRRRFLENPYATDEDREYYLVGDDLVSLYRSKALSDGGLHYYSLAGFSFQYYGPNWKVQTVSFGYDLANKFNVNLRSLSPDVLKELVAGVRITA